MLRRAAYVVISQVEKDGKYANLILPNVLSAYRLTGNDAGFVQELAFGVIRNQLLYDEIVATLSGRPLETIDIEARLLLRLGIHQLLAMRVPVHAAINETVELAKKVYPKVAGFVNAVLRKVSLKNIEEWITKLSANKSLLEVLELRHSHPKWIINLLSTSRKSWGISEPIERLLEAHNKPSKVSIVALPGMGAKVELEAFTVSGPASPIGYEISGNPRELEAIRNGTARVQDQGSQLAALILCQAKLEIADDKWLDMCAGPGGKAAVMAASARQHSTQLSCVELHPHRVKLVRESLMAFPEVEIVTGDSTRLQQGAVYSRIMLDAPCTGLGALRRRPEARWTKKPTDLDRLVDLQRDLMRSAWDALSPGGVLAYVTCSAVLAETTAQISWAQKQLDPTPELDSVPKLLSEINPDLQIFQGARTVQLWPDIHGTDAMFIALLRKPIK